MPTRRRLKLLVAAATVTAQLVVLGPTTGILEYLPGLGHLLETGLRTRVRIQVRMVLAGELAVGNLDILELRIGLYTQYLVIVLELHAGTWNMALASTINVHRRRDLSNVQRRARCIPQTRYAAEPGWH